MLVSAEPLERWVCGLLSSWRFSREDAAYIANTLVDANLRGVDSHGVLRLAAYEHRIQAGLANPEGVPVVSGTGAALRVDANGAVGQIAARCAVDNVCRAAHEQGIAAVSVHASTHFGSAGYYARAIAARRLIGIVVSNSEPIVVPFGGRSPLFGTNPFAFAAPTSGNPISIDMATSTSAMGKVLVAQQEGRSVPRDWGVDADGSPTADANAIAALLPAGGAKGYALGFLVEILGGVLAGAAVTHRIGNMYVDFDRPQDVGHFMIALDIDRFLPYDDFIDRMDDLAAEARGIDPAPGFSAVMTPGEPEQRVHAARSSGGIPLAEAAIEELRALGEKFDVPFLKVLP